MDLGSKQKEFKLLNYNKTNIWGLLKNKNFGIWFKYLKLKPRTF
jgi:hypothetical protein